MLASLWPVDDRATARLALAFYSGLAGGRSVETALREAQERIRREAPDAAPYYWAGFVAIGAAEQTIPLNDRPMNVRRLVALAAAVISLILAAFGLRSRIAERKAQREDRRGA